MPDEYCTEVAPKKPTEWEKNYPPDRVYTKTGGQTKDLHWQTLCTDMYQHTDWTPAFSLASTHQSSLELISNENVDSIGVIESSAVWYIARTKPTCQAYLRVQIFCHNLFAFCFSMSLIGTQTFELPEFLLQLINYQHNESRFYYLELPQISTLQHPLQYVKSTVSCISRFTKVLGLSSYN